MGAHLMVFTTSSTSTWNCDVGDGNPAYSFGMEAGTVSLTALGVTLALFVMVSCGEAVNETASLTTSRPPATEVSPSIDPS